MTSVQALEQALEEVSYLNAEGWSHKKGTCLVAYVEVVSLLQKKLDEEKKVAAETMTWPGAIGG